MYLETGLGQVFKQRPQAKQRPKVPPKRPPKRPVISQPRIVPEDQLRSANMRWALKVRFSRDFVTFRQEMAKAIGRHLIKNAKDITRAEDWILKREENEKKLKVIHDELLKRDNHKLKESDIVVVTTRFYYLRALQDSNNSVSDVEILNLE